jgi:hypothetical protein
LTWIYLLVTKAAHLTVLTDVLLWFILMFEEVSSQVFTFPLSTRLAIKYHPEVHTSLQDDSKLISTWDTTKFRIA